MKNKKQTGFYAVKIVQKKQESDKKYKSKQERIVRYSTKNQCKNIDSGKAVGEHSFIKN